MLLHLYSYARELSLTMPRYDGNLENTAMFNDTLKLYKKIDNHFQIKVSDRDRIRIGLSENSRLKFRIIDNRSVVISDFYLNFFIDGKYFKYTIPKDVVNKLESTMDYKFMCSFENIDDNSNVPLFIDHDFNLLGKIHVEDTFFDIISEEYTRTEVQHNEKYQYYTYEDLYLNNYPKKFRHYFNHIILNDNKIYDIQVISLDKETQCGVTFEINDPSYYPIEPNTQNWNPKAFYYGIGTETTSIMTDIPERQYARITIHTPEPDKFKLVVRKIFK